MVCRLCLEFSHGCFCVTRENATICTKWWFLNPVKFEKEFFNENAKLKSNWICETWKLNLQWKWKIGSPLEFDIWNRILPSKYGNEIQFDI